MKIMVANMMQSLKSLFCNKKKLTWISVFFIVVVVFLSCVGLSEMLSAYAPAANWKSIFSLLRPEEMFFKQLCFFIIGFAICVFISDLRLRELQYCTVWDIGLLGIVVFLLQLGTMAGPTINGTKRWLPVVSLQPCEIIPIYGVLAISWIKSKSSDSNIKWQKWGIVFLITFLCLTVWYPQGNLSTALVYFFGLSLFWFDEKKYYKWIVGLSIILIVLVMSAGMYYGYKYRTESGYPCSSFRCKRLVTWAMYDLNIKLPIEEDWQPGNSIKYKYQDKFQKYIESDGAQPVYAKTSIIKGGKLGFGFNMNVVNNRNRIAISYADYIFAILAAEHGFFVSFIVLVLAALGVLTLLSYIDDYKVAANNNWNNDPFLINLSKGVVIMLSLQSLVHIWVNLSLMPVTGIPLPLFSNGGSSLLATFIMLGILLNMTKKNEQY